MVIKHCLFAVILSAREIVYSWSTDCWSLNNLFDIDIAYKTEEEVVNKFEQKSNQIKLLGDWSKLREGTGRAGKGVPNGTNGGRGGTGAESIRVGMGRNEAGQGHRGGRKGRD